MVGDEYFSMVYHDEFLAWYAHLVTKTKVILWVSIYVFSRIVFSNIRIRNSLENIAVGTRVRVLNVF